METVTEIVLDVAIFFVSPMIQALSRPIEALVSILLVCVTCLGLAAAYMAIGKTKEDEHGIAD